MTPLHKRPIPEGYALEWDKTQWSVGHIFRWAEAYGKFVDYGRITVRPGDCIHDAIERVFEVAPFRANEYEVFFPE